MVRTTYSSRRTSISRRLLTLLPALVLLVTGVADGVQVRGQLQGGDGRPAPGVKVALHAYEMDVPLETTISGEYGETASHDREEHLATEAVEKTTDQQGGFEFTGVEEGLYVLMVSRRRNPADQRFVEEFRPLPLALGRDDVDLGALRYRRRGAYVTGTVRLDGKAASSVAIRRWAAGLGPMWGACLTDAKGQFRMYIYRVPREDSKITVTANQAGVATAVRQVDAPKPWSEAELNFDLSSEEHGAVYGFTGTRPAQAAEVVPSPPSAVEPAELIYVCAPGKGRETVTREPLVVQDGTFSLSVPVGTWDLHLVRPGHPPVVKPVEVAERRRHRLLFHWPDETEVSGRVEFTLGDQEVPYLLARTFVGPIAVRLVGDRTSEPVAEDYVRIGSEFSLWAPGEGSYRVELHSCAVTAYGPAMLERLAASPAFTVSAGEASVATIAVDLEAMLGRQVAHGLGAGPLSPAATRAAMGWVAADLMLRAGTDPSLAPPAAAIAETLDSLLSQVDE